MIDLMINLTNDNLFSAFSKPSLKSLLKKNLRKCCSCLLVYMLYEVILFNVP